MVIIVFELGCSPIRIVYTPILCAKVSANCYSEIAGADYLVITYRAVREGPGRILEPFFPVLV